MLIESQNSFKIDTPKRTRKMGLSRLKDLFATKEGMGPDNADRKLASGGTGMKSKWMKAFKSLKAPSNIGGTSSGSTKDLDKKNGKGFGEDMSQSFFENSHILQEYTYKKITACDVCHQILRGHSRQGLKCRLCKTNVHVECQDKLPKCQPKSRLLRRQRSTSEIESKQIEAGESEGKSQDEVDLIYQVLKQAGDMNSRRAGQEGADLAGSCHSSGSGSMLSLQRRHPIPRPIHTGATLTVNPAPIASSSAPSSPVHNRRLLSAHTVRMSSVELPDDNEKSVSSASASPCPSPVNKKHQRLLPTNLYVVLYNFTSRHQDELDLRAGYKVTVTDTSDPDWWQGKCLGRTGFFPSKYVTRLNAGEKPLQVTHNLQVSDGENGLKLLRDQIVIQIGEEMDGMVMIRNGDCQEGVCPIKYLQEV